MPVNLDKLTEQLMPAVCIIPNCNRVAPASEPFCSQHRDKESPARALLALQAEADRMRGALEAIAEGDEPRPTGKAWNTDGSPSKHDKCTHGVWMYEDCGQCVAEFARKALEGGAVS